MDYSILFGVAYLNVVIALVLGLYDAIINGGQGFK